MNIFTIELNLINYINDVSLENAEVLMTSDMKGNYTSAYTYGLDRISVDNLKVVNNIKTDPLYYLYDGRGSVTELINRDGQVTGKNDYEAFGITDHVGYLGNIGIYLVIGKKGDAVLSFASMIPVLNLAAGIGKLISKEVR